MKYFAAVVLFAAAASAATVPVYQSPVNVYPEVQVKDAVVPAVSTSHVYRSSVVAPVAAGHVAYPQHYATYAAQPAYATYAAQPVAYAAQPVAYAAQPVAYAGHAGYGYAQPAVHGYVSQQAYVAPTVRV